ncbi:hypothetical protein [Nocardia carnea]|uniref:hypothetical protein n=1 Tax=Nocardia carnea TaxID=37328 RepID=UPI002456D464|nr:hypothetical protein [Nocardia carnea]
MLASGWDVAFEIARSQGLYLGEVQELQRRGVARMRPLMSEWFQPFSTDRIMAIIDHEINIDRPLGPMSAQEAADEYGVPDWLRPVWRRCCKIWKRRGFMCRSTVNWAPSTPAEAENQRKLMQKYRPGGERLLRVAAGEDPRGVEGLPADAARRTLLEFTINDRPVFRVVAGSGGIGA